MMRQMSYCGLHAGRRLAAAAVIGCALLATAAAAADGSIISPQNARARAEGGGLTIVDIRRPDEWRATGLPAGARQATIRFGRGSPDFLRRIREITGGDKDAPLALICAAGVRSRHAAALLRRHGYTNVHDIGQGMLGHGDAKGWLGLGLPVKPCPDC